MKTHHRATTSTHPEPAAATASKPVLIKLGRKSPAAIAQLKANGTGSVMDHVSDIVKKLQAEGRVDAHAQVVIALVR